MRVLEITKNGSDKTSVRESFEIAGLCTASAGDIPGSPRIRLANAPIQEYILSRARRLLR